ncbi:hypothetical protein C440_06772 [Haloferax mucosum ATCC BAA-1512]|uniref:DUF58 domain-containing protein n=1 Tax=Haloferax mucosum ATCC BAA-1512 TaxID=662479 RepID=M0IJE2_9EURY|nr:DUF58 domain-containing protein [Haloferax mucosum]ELZ95973.1 hypothetical protein C440_06772 [Haloferax mucosum ATCC BAA-1512]
MSGSRRAILLVGLSSSLVGVFFLVSPALGNAVSPTGVVRTAPVAFIGVLTVVLAVVSLVGDGVDIPSLSTSDGTRPTAATEPPSPERRPRYEHPGATFARRLDAISWTDRREDEPTARLELRSELREMATAILLRREQVTRAEIEARLDDGRWTDDPSAAAFFTDDAVPSLSPRQRLRSLWSGEPPFAQRARHAVAELATRAGDTPVAPVFADAAKASLDDAPPVTTRQYASVSSDSGSPENAVGTDDVGGVDDAENFDDADHADAERTRPIQESTRGTSGVTAAALVAGGLGIITLRPALLLLALFGATISGYSRIASLPPETVAITRTVSDTDPTAGQEIDVTVSIRNTGDVTLTDLRLIDGVPAGLTVSEGSPRFTTALRPGMEVTLSYTVEAAHGVHTFDPALLVTRDVSGTQKRESLCSDSSTTVVCRRPETPLAETRFRQQTTAHSGQALSETTGAGVTFHSVREFRPGDPLSRIDWKRKAKTGEFTTIDFRERRRKTVLLLIDARAETYLAANGCDGPLVQRSATVGLSLASHYLSEDIPVGLTALSPRACWLSPNTGDAHRRRIRETLAGDPGSGSGSGFGSAHSPVSGSGSDSDSAFAWHAPAATFDATEVVREIHQRAPVDAEILFISPLFDDEAVSVARRLDAYGRTISVLSPDPTASMSPLSCGTGYASLTRRLRCSDLRGAGIPVTEWGPSESLAEVLSRGP